MSIAATVNQSIDRIPPGKIFGYEAFLEYPSAPEAVVRAVGRRVADKQLKRLAKGRFYTPKQGLLGEMKPADGEILRDVLFSKGKRRGYVTGPALYNRLGLTTQIPKTITVATNRTRQTKDFGTIRIKYVPRRAPINVANVPLLEILDVLRDAKNIPDSKVDNVINATAKWIAELQPADLKKLQRLALTYYSAATRALVGLVLDRNRQPVLPALKTSINPTTRFDVGLDPVQWPEGRAWRIK